MTKHFYPFVSVTVLALTLSACGGGKNSETSVSLSQPHSLGGKSVVRQHVLLRRSVSTMLVTTSGDKITFSYNDPSITSTDKHYQFFINTDNNTSTGFQFDETWNKSGADYLIEDNELYEATGNSNDWDSVWNYSDNIDYTQGDGFVSMTLNKSQLQGLGSQIRVGFLLRDSNWNTENFYPKSAEMSEFTVGTDPEKDTIPPVIKLNGASSIQVTLGSVYIDPGATAIDNVDGDITDNIKTDFSINTNVLGHQIIRYNIQDSAGNIASTTRDVEVINHPVTGIIVDGNKDDWADIIPFGDNKNRVYVSDSKDFLSLLFEFDAAPTNTQIFFDSDYNSATGLPLNGLWGAVGIDYMIENNQLYKKQSGSGWSWEKTGNIDYIRKDGIIEISIPKNNLSNLADTIGIGFIKRDANWNVIPELLPKAELLSYTLTSNVQVSANIHKVLCEDTNSQVLPFNEGSFENGFEFSGIDHVSKVYSTILNNGVYTLQATLPDGTVKKIGDYDGELFILSTDGALYFLSTASIYRINHDDKAVKVAESSRMAIRNRIFHINNSDYFLSLFGIGSKKPLSLERVRFNAEGMRQFKTLYNDAGNPSQEKLRIYFERNNENIENGTLFYAYTTADTRVIGVVNGSGELQPVSTCSSQ